MPELSIIIPIINEAVILPSFLKNISRQKGIDAEIIVSDGGSTDGSPDIVRDLAPEFPFPVVLVQAPPGRGEQLNAGVASSCGDYLMFLHADSTFLEDRAISKALTALKQHDGKGAAAGRFSLAFIRKSDRPSFLYFYLEQKARLSLRHCIHGDQGYLMEKESYRLVGGFREKLPVGEDTILAESIAEQGTWLLFPELIGTSARRFEQEGLKERHILNGVVLFLIHAEEYDSIRQLPQLYRVHDRTGRLDLAALIRRVEESLPHGRLTDRVRLWYGVGRYVAKQGWQLAFLLDAWLAYRRDKGGPTVRPRLLRLYQQCLTRFVDNPAGGTAAAIGAFVFFRLVGGFRSRDENG